jgi:hypothetical protein
VVLKPTDNATIRVAGESPGRSASEREVASKPRVTMGLLEVMGSRSRPLRNKAWRVFSNRFVAN